MGYGSSIERTSNVCAAGGPLNLFNGFGRTDRSMNPKQIEIRCPCCETRLVIDVLTSKVLRTGRPDEVDETGKLVLDESRWDRAQEKLKAKGTDAFDQALSKEKSREADLDALFRKAREKASDGDEPAQ